MLRFAPLLVLFWVACAPKSMSARMGHSQQLADETDALLSKAEQAMTNGQPDEAALALSDAKRVMAEPDIAMYPEYEMLQSRIKDDNAKLPAVRAAQSKQNLEREVAKRRKKVEPAGERFKRALKALEVPAVDKAAIDELNAAAAELADALKDGFELEPKDATYGADAKKLHDGLDRLKDIVPLAQARIDDMAGPAALRDQALATAKAAKSAKTPDEKKTKLEAAKALYDQCEDASRKILRATPAVSRLSIMSAGVKTTPEALDTACSDEWQGIDKQLQKLNKKKKR